MLDWLRPFSIFCFLDNGNYSIAPHHYDCLAAAGAKHFVEGYDLEELEKFIAGHDWKFGHLSYDLKEKIHGLPSRKDRIGFPPFYFFSPEVVIEIKDRLVHIHADDPEVIFGAINQQASVVETDDLPITPTFVLSKEAYLEKIKSLQQHILRGDCYEINFCMEAFANNVAFSPFKAFLKLVEVSPNPFAAFYRLQNKYLLCASPERFLTRQGNRVFSQPIKGTIKRDLEDEVFDATLEKELANSQKDRSENVMVVDLVRNDLTKVCKEASVQVDELFGIYRFPQVYQMISTISGELQEGVSFSDIISATFPMGSMTGAPKHRVMQLIEEYEPSARGIFSGSVGYIKPNGDFDFNVVIRSLMYNSTEQCLSYQVGSGITFYSDPEKEWDECLLKAQAIKKVLAQ